MLSLAGLKKKQAPSTRMLKKYPFYAIFIRNYVDDDECHIRLGYKFEVDDMYELGDSLIPSMFNFDGYDKKFVLITGKRDKNVDVVEYAARDRK